MHRSRQPMDRKMMREINQNILLNLIRTYAPISRSRLKQLSGLSLGTIVGITTALIEQQLVTEIGVAESTGGRKAELLEIVPEGGFVLGIDLREYEVVGTLLNLHGKVVYTSTWPARLRGNAAQAVEVLAAGVEDFIQQLPVSRERILGLGCGVSGPVNTRTGSCVDSWILDWHNVPLSKPLSAKIGMPVFLDNAVNCLATYEKLYGDGQKYRDFLLVTLGRGLGLAAVLRDDHFRGAQGMGAEFGHIPFEADGRLCECGKHGCLEAYVSDHGILATYFELAGASVASTISSGTTPSTDSSSQNGNTPLTIQQFFARAGEGDPLALQTLELTGTYLGQGLATLVNLFNPECIIIDGDECYRVDLLLGSLNTSMKRHIFSQLGSNLELIVKKPTIKENWVRGAGSLVLRDFFSSPG
jgi:N-acetylglucosamine repressor